MTKEFAYYDICAECGSDEIVIEDINHDDGTMDLWCRPCGSSWTDYMEDIQQEYYGAQ